MVGIVSYGGYIPQYRIKIEEIARQWGKSPREIKNSLGIIEKSVAGIDEDSLTMAYEAASAAIDQDIDKSEIKVVYVGSESHPYAVNPTATILAEFLGIEGEYLASDTQFACKAATGAIISALGLIKSDFTKLALVVAADKAQAMPHDSLEYTAGSGSVALVLGKDEVILEAVDYLSFSSDTPDFWRREGIRYPSHGGRFTGLPSYFYHIQQSSKRLLKKLSLSPKNFSQAVFHMPNGKFPKRVGKSLGFEDSQLTNSLVVSNFGNSYTASALMGLMASLRYVKPGELIFFASFGSGAGSDAFVFKVTKNLPKKRKDFQLLQKEKKYIDYSKYLKFMGII